MSKTTYYRARKKTAGLTLVEMMVVLAIILSIAAAGIPAYQYASTQAHINSVATAAKTIRSALSLYELSDGYSGGPPITEILLDGEANIQISGTMGGLPPSLITSGYFFDLEPVLIAAKALDAPINIYNGVDSSRPDSTIVPAWSTSTNTFSTTGDAGPNYPQTNRSTLECALSTHMGAPTAAIPGRFTLTTGQPIPDSARVVYWRIPNVPTSIAQAIASKLNTAVSADSTSAQITGLVNYPAPINGVTTVYVYIKHY